MRITTQQAEKLLKGSHAFSQLGFSMMLARLKTKYAKDSTPAMLNEISADINDFLSKFAPIMQEDYKIIEAL